MNRCADCKHWNNASWPQHARTERFRECGVIGAIPSNVKTENAKLPAFHEFDGEGQLITPPDFGCTLWEAKT